MGVINKLFGRLRLFSDPSVTTQTVTVIQSDTTNSSISIVPNGTGAIIASVPDGGVTGGNARGQYAVDLQMGTRDNSNQVASGVQSAIINGTRNRSSNTQASVINGDLNLASGSQSFIGNGSGNTASGQRSFIGNGFLNNATSDYSTISGGQSNTASTNTHATVVGGKSNTASGIYAIAGGKSNTATGTSTVALGELVNVSGGYGIGIGYTITVNSSYGVALGKAATASGNGSVAISAGAGNVTTASGISSVSIGNDTLASGRNSLCTGYFSNAYLFGQKAHSGQYIGSAVQGNCQYSEINPFKLDTLTTGATTVLSLDGTGTTNLIIPNGNNRAWNVQIDTIAVVTAITGTATGVSVGDCYRETKQLLFKRIGGTSSIVGTVDTTAIKNDASMATALLTVTAGASQEMALTFTAPTFTGGGSVTVRVVSKVSLVEVAY